LLQELLLRDEEFHMVLIMRVTEIGITMMKTIREKHVIENATMREKHIIENVTMRDKEDAKKENMLNKEGEMNKNQDVKKSYGRILGRTLEIMQIISLAAEELDEEAAITGASNKRKYTNFVHLEKIIF
jgi:hypothetical protein